MSRQSLLLAFITLLASTVIGQRLSAQDPAPSPPGLDELGHLAGTWKATIEQDGAERTQYLIFRERPDLNALAQWTFTVDPETKQLEQTVFGFIGIPSRTGQIQGLVFSSDGLVAEMMGALEGKQLLMKGYGTLGDASRVSADIAYTIDDQGRLIQNWTDMMTPMGHRAEGWTREFTKIEQGMRDLFRDGMIVGPGDVELHDALTPLSHLLGRWQAVDADGTVQHDQYWHQRGMGRWLVERWRLGNGRTGMNVTGIDPTSGQLTLWVVAQGVIGRVGRWDVLDDNTVGQVQGQARLNRELVKTDTDEMIVTRWQRMQNGRFVDTDSSYVVKRISRTEGDAAPRDRESTTQQAIDFGEPRMFARVEYMNVPEGGEDLYLDVEKAWKTIHRARREAGFITNWMLMKVSRAPGVQGDYNYVVVHLSDSFEQLRDGTTADLDLEFSSQEQEILAQTAASREMVGSDYWDLVATADPDRLGQPGADPTMSIGKMQSKNEARHWELEKAIWQKIWTQQVKDGALWNWNLWHRRTGEGFNFVAVHLRPEGGGAVERPLLSDEVLEKALPNMSRAEVMDAARETGEVRDMVGGEQWTLIDTLD